MAWHQHQQRIGSINNAAAAYSMALAGISGMFCRHASYQ